MSDVARMAQERVLLVAVLRKAPGAKRPWQSASNLGGFWPPSSTRFKRNPTPCFCLSLPFASNSPITPQQLKLWSRGLFQPLSPAHYPHPITTRLYLRHQLPLSQLLSKSHPSALKVERVWPYGPYLRRSALRKIVCPCSA